jgi:3-phenylpropionate/trans-cinnamate dioxygenase ferredoxin subunit
MNTAKWHKIANSIDELVFGTNNIAEIEWNNRLFCIGRHPQGLFAFAPSCPHAGVALINGYVDTLGNVVCPEHHYKFCIKTGYNRSGQGYYLRHWPIEVREDGVYLNH